MFRFLLRLLMVDRLTRLVTEDEISRPARELVERRWPGSSLSFLVNCPACVSVWAGLAVSYRLLPRRVLLALALSSGFLSLNRQEARLGVLVSAYARLARGNDRGSVSGS